MKLRNPYVLMARMRNGGGPMKHRCTPRGGSKNEQKLFLQEYEDIEDIIIYKEGKTIMAKKNETKVASNVRVAYAIFPTPFGKGYGCFAIRKNDDGTFSIAPTYCHPNDRVKFSKPKARTTAVARLNSISFTGNVKFDVPVAKEGDKAQEVSLEDIVMKYLESYLPPSWVRKSFDMGLWCFTLKFDNLTFEGYVEKLMNDAGTDPLDVAMALVSWAKNGLGFIW